DNDVDADGDTVTFAYVWTVNDAPVTPTGAPNVLDGDTDFNKGDEVACAVTPDDLDGAATGVQKTSNDLVILNSVPTTPVIDIDPLEPLEQVDDLECRIQDPSVDIDPGDTVSYTFTWKVGNTSYTGAFETNHPGDTVPLEATHAEEVWECTVVPTAGGVSGSSDSFSVTVQSEPGADGLVIGLEAPSDCVVWNVGESYEDVQALLEGAGHTVIGRTSTPWPRSRHTTSLCCRRGVARPLVLVEAIGPPSTRWWRTMCSPGAVSSRVGGTCTTTRESGRRCRRWSPPS
ncbi:MAG: hypothetical protein JRI25_25880, partial [Deltaproteobacteria bacterium]|nr:hypothetical protein [Deltaproteobacteria bacterium]